MLLPKFNLFKVDHFCLRIKFPLDKITFILKNKVSSVNTFVKETKKKDGSVKLRTFHNPNKTYKNLLKRITKELSKKVTFPKGVCGSVIGRDLFDMVSSHCGQECIYKIDLKDFFPNIDMTFVKKTILKCNCSDEVASIISELVTFNGFLPQGYPTSPLISNLVAFKLDNEQEKICKKYNIRRTRWIDDIVFSGRTKDLQKAIPAIITSVKKNKFILNEKKCKIVRRRNNAEVVGLTLNKHKPYISPAIISRINDYLNIIETNGFSSLKDFYPSEFEKKDVIASIKGKINYIKKFNQKDYDILVARLDEIIANGN